MPIPLPALQVQSPQIESPIQQLGQVAALKNAQQQQVLGQQKIQANQVELQQQQRDQQDEELIRQAQASQPGATLHDILPSLGGKLSAKGFMRYQDMDLKMRKQYSEQTKADLDNSNAQHAQYQQIYDNVMNMPDQQMQASWPQIVDSINSVPGNKIKLDPAQPLNKQQLSQFGPMLSLNDAYLKSEQAKREATAKLAQTEAATKKDLAEAGRMPVEQQELRDYLADSSIDKGKNKNAATFASWKAKQSPAAIAINSNMLGAGGAGSALDQQATRFHASGDLPAGFSRSPGTTAAIIKRSAELYPNDDIATNKAVYGSLKSSLTKLQTNFNQVTAFENTAGKNLDLFLQKAEGLKDPATGKTTGGVTDLGAKFLNTPLRLVQRNMMGTADMAAFDAARTTALTEIAKVLNSSNAAGVLSDSARHEVEGLIGKDATLSSIISAAKVLKQDMANRHQSYQDEINTIQGQLRSPGGTQQPATGQPNPTQSATSGSFDWNQFPQHK